MIKLLTINGKTVYINKDFIFKLEKESDHTAVYFSNNVELNYIKVKDHPDEILAKLQGL